MEKIEFIKIDKKIEQVIGTSSFLARVKGQDKNVLKMLREEFEKDTTNYENAVAYTYFKWFLTNGKTDLGDTNFVYEVTFSNVEALNETLEEKPEYWILWILKYKIYSYMNFDENDFINSMEILIKQQNECEKMPYYLISEVLLAHFCYTKDNTKYAKEILERVMDNYTDKITILHAFFIGIVYEFRNIAKRSGDDDILELVESVLKKFF
ncbi:hypothetical protein [[Clostridium] polysaccharolyticum]|uniref:Uncharacterized protein n=1 Tax=[Clostridium] polysaccharolyticum TaxID=29364 RepID=A0A1H9ZT70_9FIRM|nr:hypothetical protein [[Clostridium] polysaccharolyticum]SES84915.1 hypothetical protein SAMN04487772_104110 [[Clostridium] polysaccharolyticum]